MLIIQCIVSIFSYNCSCIFTDEVRSNSKIYDMVVMLSGILSVDIHYMLEMFLPVGTLYLIICSRMLTGM